MGVEENPLPVFVPDSIRGVSPDLYEFLRSLTASIREQHTLSQAGNPTFSWELLTQLDSERRYIVGSRGSFYHPQFGVIGARYVRFGRMNPDLPIGGPVGLALDYVGFDWVVSNDVTQTRDHFARGLPGAGTVPLSDSYGWIVTNGVNVQPVTVTGQLVDGIFLTWEDDGTIHLGGDGITFGQPVAAMQAVMPIGSILVDTAGALGGLQAGQRKGDSIDIPIVDETRIRELELAFEGLEKSTNFKLGLLSRSFYAQDANSVLLRMTQKLSAAANFANLGEIAANKAGFAANLTDVKLQAVNGLTRTVRLYRDEAGFHAETSTRAELNASLRAIDSDVSAQASFVSEQNAETHATEAGVSAQASDTARLAAEVAAGDSAASAELSREDSVKASDSAAEAKASELLAAQYRDEARVGLDDLTTRVTKAEADISDEKLVRADADEAIAQRVLVIEGSYVTEEHVEGIITPIATTIANAKVAEEAQIRADVDGAQAERILAIETSYVTTGALNTAVTASYNSSIQAIATAEQGLSQRIDTQRVDFDGLNASLNQTNLVVNAIGGRANVYWAVTGQAGPNRASIELKATNEVGGYTGFDITGDVRIYGNLLVNGSVTATQIAQNAITNSARVTGGSASFRTALTEVARIDYTPRNSESTMILFVSGIMTIGVPAPAGTVLRVSVYRNGGVIAQYVKVASNGLFSLTIPNQHGDGVQTFTLLVDSTGSTGTSDPHLIDDPSITVLELIR